MTGGERRLEAPHRRGGASPRIVERSVVLAYRAMAWVLRTVPARPAGALIGLGAQASYLLWPTKRAWSNRNFGHVLGLPPDHPRVRRLALRAYRVYGDYLVELMRVPFMRTEEVVGLIEPMDLAEIEAMRAMAPDGGIICTVGHVGSNDAIGAAIAHMGLPLNAVADDSSFPELFDLLKRQREQWSATIIPWRNLRAIFGVLRRRELLALLVDWGYRSDGIPVTLFGAWTTLPAGPATLAAKTKSLIVPIIATRQPDRPTARHLGGPDRGRRRGSGRPAAGDPARRRRARRSRSATRRRTGTASSRCGPRRPRRRRDLERRALEMQAGRKDPGPSASLARDPDDQTPDADRPVEAA